MLLPALTGSGLSVFVIARSALVFTVVVAVAELLPGVRSVVVLETAAVLLIVVAAAVLALTLTTIVKIDLAPFAKLGLLQLMVPMPPADGLVQLQPVAPELETKVVFVGTVSERETL